MSFDSAAAVAARRPRNSYALPAPTAHVLHGRPLRPATALRNTARFSDDLWSLEPATLQGHERRLILRFDIISEQYRETFKLLCYATLSGDLPPGEPRPSISALVTHYYSIRKFLTWLASAESGCPLEQVSADVLRRYQLHLLGQRHTLTRRHALRHAVTMLWRYRECLDGGGLPLDPRTVAGWHESLRAKSSENTTPRIPEAVHAPLLMWALRFVNDFSTDILTASARWDDLRDHPESKPEKPTAYGQPGKELRAYLAAAVADSRPLPGIGGVPNHKAIQRIVGCSSSVTKRNRAAIGAAAAAVGVSEYAAIDAHITAQLDGQPWLEGVSVDPIRDDSITVLVQTLQAACYIVVAFLSGMRESEVKHLRAGCCTALRDRDGTAYRWQVTSLAFKGENDPAGVPATWIVGEPAARAIDVLERLHAGRGRGRTDWLFSTLKAGPSADPSGPWGMGSNKAMTAIGTNVQLNRFITWVNDYCTRTGRTDGIPDVDGKPWHLSSRQFRRTFAWYIARRPGGSIVGAIAYRHHSIQMFEGYAGTSDSGFRAEVEAEEALARGEYLLAMIDRHEHKAFTGPAADEAQRRLEQLGERARFSCTVTTDRQRIIRLTNRAAVYPGEYATCIYDPAKALCHAKTGTADQTPDLTSCKPLACRNVALDDENLGAWRRELELLDADLASEGLPPLLLGQLGERRRHVQSFLDRHTKESR